MMQPLHAYVRIRGYRRVLAAFGRQAEMFWATPGRERESAGEGEPDVAGARERERQGARVVRSVGEGDSESEK